MQESGIFNSKLFIQHFASYLLQYPKLSNCIMSFLPISRKWLPENPLQMRRFLYHSTSYCFEDYCIVYGGFGAPSAGISTEICFELGIKNIITIGTCGTIQSYLKSGDVIIPNDFIREEGTSWHYPDETGKYIGTPGILKNTLCELLKSHDIPYFEGLHWTIDAPFRETKKKVQKYQKEGCLSVDMETSAIYSIAAYYKKSIASVLIASDSLSRDEWVSPQPSKRIVNERFKQIFGIIPQVFKEIKSTH